MNDTALRRLLERIADLTILGLLTLLACAGVITGLAGLTATAAALTGNAGTGAVVTQWLRALREHWRPAMALQLMWLGGAAVGLIDTSSALRTGGVSGPLGWAAVPVLAAGALLLITAIALPPYLALFQATAPARWPTTLRRACITAAARPVTAGAVVVLSALGLTLAVALPILGPLLVGVHLLVCITAVRSTVRRALRTHSLPPALPLNATLTNRRISLP